VLLTLSPPRAVTSNEWRIGSRFVEDRSSFTATPVSGGERVAGREGDMRTRGSVAADERVRSARGWLKRPRKGRRPSPSVKIVS